MQSTRSVPKQNHSTRLKQIVEELEKRVTYQDENSLFFGIPCALGETWGICKKKMKDIMKHDMKINETMLIGSVQRISAVVLVRFHFATNCSSSSPTADPSGSLWLQDSSQPITELKPTSCLQQPRPWTRKKDFLPTQRFWLTAGPFYRVFNRQEGARSSATSDRSCPCFRTKHLWPSSGSLLIVVLEATRKQTGCQKWKAI